MARPRVGAAGGWAAIFYFFRKAQQGGGIWRVYRRLRSRNACKTCALGMGGQKGGMVNEAGHFPEVCKKSIQAQVGDMQKAITEDFLRQTPIALLAKMSSAQCEALGRVGFPLLAEQHDTHFRRIGWDEALERATQAFASSKPDRTFFYASGRSSNEAAFLLQLIARAYGTSNIHNCSYYCHSASGVALSQVYGSGTASIVLEDLAHTDLAIVAGANPASNHPRLITQLVQLRRRGGKVIVVNPLRELGLTRFRIPSDWRSLFLGSSVSDLYLQPHVGQDIAVFKAILKGLIETNAVDRDYLQASTSGFPSVHDDVRASSWESLLHACGLSRQEIDEAVQWIGAAKRGVVMWSMGLTHHVHGVDNILALCNIALSRGWLGKPGAGMLPIRGHSNVQGVGSVGVAPALKDAFATRLEQLYGIRVPRDPGQDTYASLVAADAQAIDAALLLGGNLYASNPDLHWAGQALRKIKTTVSLTTKLNVGHVHGRGQTAIILPVLARDEETQRTTQESMFNYVRVSEGGMPAIVGEMRSEVAILAALAQELLPKQPFNWSSMSSHEALRRAIAEAVPGYQRLTEVDQNRTEFQLNGRTFHTPNFPTADGRAHFHVTPLSQERDPQTFTLMTLRSEGQFNTVVYEEEDLYRGNTRRDVVMMAEQDANVLKLEEGDRVVVSTDCGELEVSVALVPIRPGNLAMYYPEANVLVPRRLDPRSKTPGFKSIGARLRKCERKRLSQVAARA